MNETVDRYIDVLKKQGIKINDTNFNLTLWKAETSNFLQRIFGKKTPKTEQIDQITYQSTVADSGYIYSDNLEECKEQAKAFIKSYIYELQTFGIEEMQTDSDTSTTKMNKSSNAASIEVQSILEIIQYELTGRQYKDIQEIISSNLADKEKIAQLSDKIKTFSADVAANILANIFTQIGEF